MAGNVPEERVRRPMATQTWRHVSMLHWPLAASLVRSRLPAGLTPDVVDGSAWISIVAFEVEGFRVPGGLPGSARPSFPETNLRTYARHESGRDGLWFLSLDVPGWLNVIGGRLVGIPYHVSAMTVEAAPAEVRYRSSRRAGRKAGLDMTVSPGPEPNPTRPELAELLAGRWRAFTRLGRLLEVPVEHEPWSLQAARVERIDETLFDAAGFTRPAVEPLATYSDRVHARLGYPRPAAI